jgi:hypothetical protein
MPACYGARPPAVGYTAARCVLHGVNDGLRQGLAGTEARSCHAVFGHIDSEYFLQNPGAAENVPHNVSTIRALSPLECGRVLADLGERPRRQMVRTFTLRLCYWNNLVLPWLTRWLLRRTAARRIDPYSLSSARTLSDCSSEQIQRPLLCDSKGCNGSLWKALQCSTMRRMRSDPLAMRGEVGAKSRLTLCIVFARLRRAPAVTVKSMMGQLVRARHQPPRGGQAREAA